MPHQCTSCGHNIGDGERQLFNGCPECDGQTFQFVPSSALTDSPPETSSQDPTKDETSDNIPDDIGFLIRDSDTDGTESSEEIGAITTENESDSQHSARTDIVSQDELSAYDSHGDRIPKEPTEDDTSDDTPIAKPDEETPSSLDELREELNDQFEAIRITNPGQYEINLTKLYEGDGRVVSLREDGRYVVNVPGDP